MDGALLIHKHAGVSSFGVIEELKHVLMRNPGAYGRTEAFERKRDLPKLGHGGTLDPFATGLLAVCVGRGVKLARYFLGSRKVYEGVIRFGEATVPGDPTAPISERSPVLPASLESARKAAQEFCVGDYSQTPPMHSAKKVDGKVLYELAREGIEIEREARVLKIYSFEILTLERAESTIDGGGAHPIARARFRVECSSGTYVRTLAQDLARKLSTVAMLDTLHRVGSGHHSLERAMTVAEILAASAEGRRWDELPAWMPFDRLLDGYERAEATEAEATALFHGKQGVLPDILSRRAPGPAAGASWSEAAQLSNPGAGADTADGARSASRPIAIYHSHALIAIARQDAGVWGLERVFTPDAV